ncbi:hypothetical protein AAG570_006865 [Ranatra chinensis]|uniref:Cyclic nucleotide-binding domain-containing protein n=1 Tax=Ranatra chinensis TaxID=642074 RepID=A0ABD0ZC83_9HEMI
MASKRRNMFYKNKKQETMKIVKVTDLKEMLSMHVYAFYFASEISMSAGLGDLMPQDRAEITFIIIAIAIKFGSTSLFRGMPEVLLRDIAILLEEKYFYSGTKIVQKNDIIDYILILYEGKVCVVDSLDVAKRPLDRGSIFGNFDDSPRVRIALSLLAKTHATLLMLKSAKLYELAKNYPLMLKRLELTVLQNRIALNFVTPYEAPSTGEIIKDPRLIRKRMVENEVLSYAKTLWSTRKGVQVSEFLPSTPQQLKEELFLEMYGHHFKSVSWREGGPQEWRCLDWRAQKGNGLRGNRTGGGRSIVYCYRGGGGGDLNPVGGGWWGRLAAAQFEGRRALGALASRSPPGLRSCRPHRLCPSSHPVMELLRQARCADNGTATTAAGVECKVVLVGDTKCGKTSLIHMFISETFNQGTYAGMIYAIRSAESSGVDEREFRRFASMLKASSRGIRIPRSRGRGPYGRPQQNAICRGSLHVLI